MKRFIVAWMIIVFCALAGCSSAPFRTGAVVVDKFSIDSYKTSNPVAIKKDVAEHIQTLLHHELLNYIVQDSNLTVADSCDHADYRLTGKVEEINAEIDSHYRFVTITVNNKFEVEIEGALLNCKTGAQVVEFSASEDDENMHSAVENLAESIVKDIRKDPTLVPVPQELK